MVNGRLRSQHVKTVVKLDRVLVDPVLEAHPFGAAPQIGRHFAAKPTLQLLAQKTHDLLAAQIEHSVQDQARKQSLQGTLVTEKHITGKLGLGAVQ